MSGHYLDPSQHDHAGAVAAGYRLSMYAGSAPTASE